MHTPGPWKALPALRPADGSYQLAGDDPAREIGVLLPPVVSTPTEREANVRLITAAPDMLAALEDIIQRNEIQHWFNLDKARAAVAKAKS